SSTSLVSPLVFRLSLPAARSVYPLLSLPLSPCLSSLSLHDALPICVAGPDRVSGAAGRGLLGAQCATAFRAHHRTSRPARLDRGPARCPAALSAGGCRARADGRPAPAASGAASPVRSGRRPGSHRRPPAPG